MLKFALTKKPNTLIVATLLFLMIGFYPKSVMAQYFDENDMILDAQDELEGWHAYQPVFNGLKYRSGSWEKRITPAYGARFFDKEMVTTSLSLVISTEYDQMRKDFASGAEIAELCKVEGAVPEDYSSAHTRLIGLCALDTCERYSQKDWRFLTESLKMEARKNSLRDKSAVIVASDAVFVARVTNRCGFQDITDELLSLSKPLIDSALSIYSQCETVKCQVEDTNFAYSVFPVAASILIAHIDIPDIPDELRRLTRAYWTYRKYDISDIADDRVDKNIVKLCEYALYPASSCRDRFKYSFFLERHFLDRMSKLKDTSNLSDAIALFKSEFAEEINIRNSGN